MENLYEFFLSPGVFFLVIMPLTLSLFLCLILEEKEESKLVLSPTRSEESKSEQKLIDRWGNDQMLDEYAYLWET